MKSIYKYLFAAFSALFLLALSSCEIETVVDPNNPSVGSATNNASLAEMQFLVTGLEARNRGYMGSHMFTAFGREVWPYQSSDPRFIGDWLDIGGSGTYSDFFGSGGTYTTPYQAVKQANVVIEAADNSGQITGAQASGAKGIAKTLKGLQLTIPLAQQWDNGIRIDVADPLNPGPYVGEGDPLVAYRAILDVINDGLSDINAAGGSLGFSLSAGFAGFNSPAGFAQVNRALAARVALYAEDYSAALSALGGSFMDLNVDAASSDKMNIGPKLTYGQPPDASNPFYAPFDKPTGALYTAHPAWVEDAEPGDARLNKVAQLIENPQTNPGLRDINGDLLVGEWQDVRWADNSAAIPFIRNEELILIYAEANLMSGNSGEATNAINIVRNTWGIGDYSGGTSQDELLEEILHQRRYSLWHEGGHRWIDLRRTGKLDSDHVDLRDTGSIIEKVARPTAEINWDAG